MKKKDTAVGLLRAPSRRGRVSFVLRASRRFRLPFALLSSAAVVWLAPGLLGVWFAVLFVLFGLLPWPRQVQRPPTRRVWSPGGQQWLRQQQQRQQVAVRPARVYRLWSQAEWRARSAALPWAPRRRFLARGPV